MARNLDHSRRYITIAAIVALLLALLALYACNFGGVGVGAPEIDAEQVEPPDLDITD